MTRAHPASPSRDYRFCSAWTIPARCATDPVAVYDVLEDVASYPRWWKSVPAVVRLGEDAALVLCRSRLPKTLRLELRPVEQDRDRGVLRARLDGQLTGWSEFVLSASEHGGVDVVYRQDVDVTDRLLDWAGRVARPVLEWNHEQMMRRLRLDLEAALAPRG